MTFGTRVALRIRNRFTPLDAAIVVCCCALIALLWGVVLFERQSAREDAIAAAYNANSNLAIAFEEQTVRALHSIDQALALVKREYLREGRRLDLAKLIESAGFDTRLFSSIGVIDERGNRVLNSSSSASVNVADREPFLHHREHDDPGLYIGAPLIGRVSGNWTIRMTRRIDKPGGGFGGIVGAAVDPTYFTSFYAKANIGEVGTIILAKQDGTGLVRRSGQTYAFGEDMRDSRLIQESARQPAGNFVGRGRVDGVRRLFGYRKLEDYPLVVAVGTSEAEALRAFEEDERTDNLMASLGSGFVAALGTWLWVALARQRRAASSLAAKDAQLRATVDQAAVGISRTAPDGRFLEVNQTLCRMLGYREEELLSRSFADITHPEDLDKSVQLHESLYATNIRSGKLDKRYLRKDGSVMWAETVVTLVPGEGGSTAYVVAVVQDVTARKSAERRAERLNAFYGALSHTNQAIVRIREPDALYREICRLCVEFGHVRMALIAVVQGERIVPVASAGPAEDYLRGLELRSVASAPEGRGPAGTALREGRPYICNDFFADPVTQPWRDRAERSGLRSAAVFPIRRGGRPIGVLILYDAEPGVFDAELVALLEEMAVDISFALDNFDREAALAESGERFRSLVESAMDAIVTVGEDQRIVQFNAAASALFQVSSERAVGMPLERLIPERFRAAHALHLGRFGESGEASRRMGETSELFALRADGTEVPIEASVSRSLAGGTPQFTVILRDITARKRFESRIEYLATHDGLTDLPNRNLIRDRIAQSIGHARRAGIHLALMFVDLDRFKVVNDGFGHPFGDLLLKAAGERFQAALRDDDTVARLGGDEFLILLTDLHHTADVYIVAQKILDALDRPFALEGREVHLSASIGVSLYPQDGEDFDTLLGHADVAMYRAKDMGRGTYQFFTPAMSAGLKQRVELEAQLRRALEKGELRLAFQPKVDLASGAISGAEVLLHWSHPELGLVTPANFIPLAEETGLIVPIGEWVLRSACAQAKAWTDAGLPPVAMAVNVSARQFLHHDIVALVESVLEQTGLPPGQLELELTETLIARDVEKVAATIRRLHSAGVRFSIDDFGTGYSNLSQLKRFRVDRLKIDQSFVRNLHSSRNDAAIALAIISLARALDLKVIAEGVETAEQCAFLRKHGCDEIQGYYFSRPVTAEQLEAMLREGKRLARPAARAVKSPA
jgi:diguanylate cyclase (GGDEF)-like protein/PAS domain S-box-containing protein